MSQEAQTVKRTRRRRDGTARRKYREIFLRDGGRCTYCRMDLTTFDGYMHLSFDHVQARSRGGTDDPSNLVLCCQGCNQVLSRKSHLQTVDERRTEALRLRERIKALHAEALRELAERASKA